MNCYHCKEPLRVFRVPGSKKDSIERSVFRTPFAENGDYSELPVHPRCAAHMYGKFHVVKHILESKKDYPIRPNARHRQLYLKVEFEPIDISKEMDVAEMTGFAKVPCSDENPEGFDLMLAFHCAKGQVWPGRHHALKNNSEIKVEDKSKKTYVPEALEDPVDRGDVTRLMNARIAAEQDRKNGTDPKGQNGK